LSAHLQPRGNRGLTFDDGPCDATPDILATLTATGIAATFYLQWCRWDRHGVRGGDRLSQPQDRHPHLRDTDS
jgi:hypothetical protein